MQPGKRPYGYAVAEHEQRINKVTGVVVEETYRVNGNEHRNPEEGPAYIRRDFQTGKVIVEEYIVDNQHDRAGKDLPSSLHYDEQGRAKEVRYFALGKLHRDPALGPARICYNSKTGAVTRELYMVRDQKHRDPADGPAMRLWSRVTGKLLAELYYVEDKLHRDPEKGPALIRYRPDGSVSKEVYYQFGERVPVSENPDRPSGGVSGTSRSELRRRFMPAASFDDVVSYPRYLARTGRFRAHPAGERL